MNAESVALKRNINKRGKCGWTGCVMRIKNASREMAEGRVVPTAIRIHVSADEVSLQSFDTTQTQKGGGG